MYQLHNKSRHTARRKKLRAAATKTERIVWKYLRGKQLGYKFRRQHGIWPYIVDFYCKEVGLVIEIDGSVHADRQAYDTKREKYITSYGLRVLRIRNEQVLGDIESVLIQIASVCREKV